VFTVKKVYKTSNTQFYDRVTAKRSQEDIEGAIVNTTANSCAQADIDNGWVFAQDPLYYHRKPLFERRLASGI